MRVVLHVGAHKTGSSLVQRYLQQAPRRRMASGCAVIPRHHTNDLIGWGHAVVVRPERLRRRIEAEARRHADVLVISHESSLGRPFEPDRSGLYPNAAERIDALAGVCAGFDTRVVFYVRPVASFVESFYLQTVQEGATHSFDTWFAGIDGDSLSWGPIVDRLDAAFGRADVRIGDFGEIGLGQTSFLQGFLDRSGIMPWTTVRYRHRSNPSLSAAGLEIALQRNQGLREMEERAASRRDLQRRHSNRDAPRARPMPSDVRSRLDASTAADYATLAGRALGDRAANATATR
jgi:hypothetical protein